MRIKLFLVMLLAVLLTALSIPTIVAGQNGFALDIAYTATLPALELDCSTGMLHVPQARGLANRVEISMKNAFSMPYDLSGYFCCDDDNKHPSFAATSCSCSRIVRDSFFSHYSSTTAWCSSCNRNALVTVRVYNIHEWCLDCGRFSFGTIATVVGWDCAHGRSLEDDDFYLPAS